MKNFYQTLSAFVVIFIIATSAFAQGTISGTILDEKSGEAIIGANVVLESDGSIGTTTDWDGKYQFELAAGTHTIVVSYIGYPNKKVTDIIIKDGEVTYLDVMITEEAMNLDIVVVQAKAIERSEVALMTMQRKSDKIQDGISAQEMKLLGAGNAATAMKKITGASVQGGKYIYVRGLGDRYSTAQLNGIQLPSTDPYRNSAQLDMIPANLLENIITSKTFTPDQPGTFTGGNVDIKTKSFPEERTISFSLNSSYNTQSSFNSSFLTYSGGKTDFLGYDDGTRAIDPVLLAPENLEYLNISGTQKGRNDDAIAAIVDQAAKSLNPQMAPTTTTSPLNHGFSFSYGNQFNKGDNPIGLIFGLNYKKSYKQISNGFLGDYQIASVEAENMNEQGTATQNMSTATPNIGGMLGLSYKISDNSTIAFSTLYNHISDNTSLVEEGSNERRNVNAPDILTRNVNYFNERELLNYQLDGKHTFPGLKNAKLEWIGTYTQSKQTEPDFRVFLYEFDPENDKYTIDLSSYAAPAHIFRDLTDNKISGKVDFTLPILQDSNKGNKVKVGALYSTLSREFNQYTFRMAQRQNEAFTGDVDAFFAADNVGSLGKDENGRNQFGLYVDNNSDPSNRYTGTDNSTAAYAMTTLNVTDQLKFIGGARMETTDLSAATLDESDEPGNLNSTNVLPSAGLTYAVNDKMNVRAVYSNTIARPNMREFAPFVSYDAINDYNELGNPDLTLTDITNLDLRWEYFFNAGEIFALSGYYKSFDNAIVKTFTPASSREITWENVDESVVYGVELEFRKSLNFISENLKNFKISTNVSFTHSETPIADETQAAQLEKYIPDFKGYRPFQGQSPYIFNANLSYVNRATGIDAIIAYNVFGDRLFINGQGNNPDIYEKSRGQLDASFSKSFESGLGIRVFAQNILNPSYALVQNFKGTEYFFRNYKLGQTIGASVTYNIR